MKRGEVWWVNFDPSIGGAVRKKRPAVIVSNNAANQFLNRVQVIPRTSNIDKLYPSETYIAFGGKRLISHAGTVSSTELEGIKRAISIQLDL